MVIVFRFRRYFFSHGNTTHFLCLKTFPAYTSGQKLLLTQKANAQSYPLTYSERRLYVFPVSKISSTIRYFVFFSSVRLLFLIIFPDLRCMKRMLSISKSRAINLAGTIPPFAIPTTSANLIPVLVSLLASSWINLSISFQLITSLTQSNFWPRCKYLKSDKMFSNTERIIIAYHNNFLHEDRTCSCENQS